MRDEGAAKDRELFETELEASYKDTEKARCQFEQLANAVNLCVAAGHLKENALNQAKEFVERFYIKKEN